MSSALLTEAAFIALIPAGALLYLILDRYATPRVPVSVFDERNLLIAFVAGIPGGLPLALLFLVYEGSLASLDLVSATAYLLLFLAVATLGRTILLKIQRFGGKEGKLRAAPFYALAFGCGSAVTIMLATADSALPGTNQLYGFPALMLLSIDLVLLESWAGIRFARRKDTNFRIFVIAGIEALGLVAAAPLFIGIQYVQFGALFLLLALTAYLVHSEDLHTLRPLVTSRRKGDVESPYQRTDTS